MTHEEYLAVVAERNPNFEVLSEYKGFRQKIKKRCKICGTVSEALARSLIEKQKDGRYCRCKICASSENGKRLRKTNEDFISDLFNVNPNIKPLDVYTTNDTRIKCECLVCGAEFTSKPHILLQGHGCYNCYKKSHNWRTNDEFVLEMKQKHPNVIPLEKFVKCNKTMKFKCNKCDYVWNTHPNVLLNDKSYSGCPKCSGYSIPLTEMDFINRVKNSNEYVEYIEGFKGLNKHALFKCKRCGNIWDTLCTSILAGSGCPNCNLSRGEKIIKKILESMNIEFVQQAIFKDCIDKKCLPFDFYIPSKNTCIEFDGAQHFEPVRFSKSLTDEEVMIAFEERIRRDEIKTNYCKEHNIVLLRIPYTELDNIETILNKHLS